MNQAGSRFQILEWINDLLLINMRKIEELGSGNVYYHLLDAAYPKRIPLHKVKWDAKLETDFLHNFKILQNSFEFLGIEKAIEVCNQQYSGGETLKGQISKQLGVHSMAEILY